MSSMRNAAPRRPHKERSQPAGRSKWGLLEKHKDYSLRARDYAQKQRKLSILQTKARERNPDEFAFGMLRADTARQGQHGRGDRPEDKLSVEAAKLLKTQDVGYLRTVGQKSRREIEELERKVEMQNEMINGTSKGNGRKIVFVEDGEDKLLNRNKDGVGSSAKALERPGLTNGKAQREDGIDLNDENDLPTEENTNLLPTSSSTSQKQALAAKLALAEARVARKRRKRLAEARITKLHALKRRQKEIMAAAERLEEQRAKMARSVGGTNKDGVKFRIRERRK